MKKLMLLIMLSGLWHKACAQARAGMGQYMYIGERQVFTLAPVIYYQSSKKWYMEARYNYEALKTVSFYAGRTFEKRSTVSYSASPVAGVVMGRYTGGSVGANTGFDYKKLFFSSQFQYTFSTNDRSENFFYSWSDLSYQVLNNIYTGISVQQTNLYKVKYRLEKGIFFKTIIKKFTFPLYIFNPALKERYFVLGLACDW